MGRRGHRSRFLARRDEIFGDRCWPLQPQPHRQFRTSMRRRSVGQLTSPGLQCRRFFIGPQRRALRLSEEVAHPRELVFKVVSDVSRYSEFLPFCTVSDIVKRRDDCSFDARLSLGFMAFTEEYVSRVQVRAKCNFSALRLLLTHVCSFSPRSSCRLRLSWPRRATRRSSRTCAPSGGSTRSGATRDAASISTSTCCCDHRCMTRRCDTSSIAWPSSR